MFEFMREGHGWGMGGGMWLFTLLFWIALIFAFFYIGRGFLSSKDNSGLPPNTDSPLTILKKRYASGDIDEVTFKRMKKQLEENEQ